MTSAFRGALLGVLVLPGALLAEDPAFDPDGPFRPGEGFGTPATCATLPLWIDRAPEVAGRISMTVDGVLSEAHWDGALAYLILCEPEEVQVMCVTYHPREVDGETIRIAGGYQRVGDRQVILDPCLVFPAE